MKCEHSRLHITAASEAEGVQTRMEVKVTPCMMGGVGVLLF